MDAKMNLIDNLNFVAVVAAVVAVIAIVVVVGRDAVVARSMMTKACYDNPTLMTMVVPSTDDDDVVVVVVVGAVVGGHILQVDRRIGEPERQGSQKSHLIPASTDSVLNSWDDDKDDDLVVVVVFVVVVVVTVVMAVVVVGSSAEAGQRSCY
jgi:hypothetical protein